MSKIITVYIPKDQEIIDNLLYLESLGFQASANVIAISYQHETFMMMQNSDYMNNVVLFTLNDIGGDI